MASKDAKRGPAPPRTGSPKPTGLVVKDANGNVLSAPSFAKHNSHLQSIDAAIAEQQALKISLDKQITALPRTSHDARKAHEEQTRARNAEITRLRHERTKYQAAVEEAERHRETTAKEAAASKARVAPATIAEQIAAVEKRLATGSLTLVENKKATQELAQLKSRLAATNAAQEKESAAASKPLPAMTLEEARKGLDDVQKRLAANEAAAAEAAKQTTNAAEIERNKRTELQEQIRQASQKLNELHESRRTANQEYNTARDVYEKALQKARKEEAAREKEATQAQRRAERLLPKYESEIAELSNLINHLRRTYLSSPSSSSPALPAAAAASAGDKDEHGTLINRRGRVNEEESFMAPSNRKSVKTATPSNAAQPKAPTAIKLDVVVLHTFSKFKVAPPTAVSQVEETIEALDAAKASYVKKQEDEIAKGRLEEEAERKAEAAAAAKAATAPATNTEESQE